jgi:hypothetical protein
MLPAMTSDPLPRLMMDELNSGAFASGRHEFQIESSSQHTAYEPLSDLGLEYQRSMLQPVKVENSMQEDLKEGHEMPPPPPRCLTPPPLDDLLDAIGDMQVRFELVAGCHWRHAGAV